MILHGLFGPNISPKNLATTLTWVHFRGALVLVLLCAGNFFCLACPFMLVRQAARKIFRPRFDWPRWLRNKWLSVGLFVLILFTYELFDLWASPWWTAWLIIFYFLGVLVVDGFFKHASFCKFVCPIGQFNFVASTLSPLEVKVRDQDVCTRCQTKDCIRGRREPVSDLVVIRGCELALFQPRKVGNMDCTFCMDCVHACPHDNVGILSRLPGGELLSDPLRSGIGYFSNRKDLAALALVFTFGALLNAFGMVSPVYALENWLGHLLHVGHESPVLGIIFMAFLVLEPILLLGLASWLTVRTGGSNRALVPLAVRYSYALVPLGFGMWLAHYGFHFLTGLLTIIPVTPECFDQDWDPSLGGTEVDAGGGSGPGCPGDRNRVSAPGIRRVFGHYVRPSGRRRAPAAHARFHAVGVGVSDCLDGFDVAYVSAHGNARHVDERIGMNCRGTILAGMLTLLCALPVRAHNGPPFPIIENQRMGPCVISLWTHPDIGMGTFFVFVEPSPGASIPGDLKFNIGIQPESKRLPEVVYAMNREDDHGQVQYKASVDFDRGDFFRVRLILQDSQRKGRNVFAGRGNARRFRAMGFAVLSFAVPGSGISVVPGHHAQAKSHEAATTCVK